MTGNSDVLGCSPRKGSDIYHIRHVNGIDAFISVGT